MTSKRTGGARPSTADNLLSGIKRLLCGAGALSVAWFATVEAISLVI
jgi:hypothetical protein